MRHLVVVGQGYVGLPMALCATESGLTVVGLDANANVVSDLNAGRSHIDDVSDDELGAAIERGFRATTDPSCIADADAIVVCVPTPLFEDGGPDLGAVEAAARSIAANVRTGSLVVLESTTYPGTTEEIFARIITGDQLIVGQDVYIAFSPERIDPGNTQFNVRNTPKVVGGLTRECTRRARELYEGFIDTVVEAKGAKEAEMAKLLENTFRHVNIALVNEMVRFCDELDIDLWDAIDCAETKPFGYMAFRPGPGVGGHCIPVDPSYLSHRVKAKLGYAFRMVELAEEINLAAPGYVADRVWKALNADRIAVNGARVLLVGVTYKPNISDLRETPALPLARKLLGWGADLQFHDPYVPRWSAHPGDEEIVCPRAEDLYAAAAAADIVVLLQPHAMLDLVRLTKVSNRLLDTRGVLPDEAHVVRL